jgi:hypothetical protein
VISSLEKSESRCNVGYDVDCQKQNVENKKLQKKPEMLELGMTDETHTF